MERLLLHNRQDGTPVYTHQRVPGVLPVGVMRFDHAHDHSGVPLEQAHAHDFLVLSYFERGGGMLRLAGREWQIAAGDAYVIAPGEVVDARYRNGLTEAEGWAVFFPPDLLGSQASGTFLSWRAHPLLFPFARGAVDGVQRLAVPEADRRAWAERCAALEQELHQRRDGYWDAAMAHLTLLLIALARVSADVAGEFRHQGEPLLAEVFGVIENRYHERLSLRDVAQDVSLTPGHVATVVRQKTGRTVLEWINERRFGEARRLLMQSDLPVSEVARQVGFEDVSYFVRVFRRAHGTTPLGWRKGRVIK